MNQALISANRRLQLLPNEKERYELTMRQLQFEKDHSFSTTLVHQLTTGQVRFTNADYLKNVCLKLAESRAKALSIGLVHFVKDPYLQFVILKECAKRNGIDNASFIPNLKQTDIKNPDHLALIAIEACKSFNFNSLFKLAKENGINFDNHQLALAKASVHAGEEAASFLKTRYFKELSNDEKFEVYKYGVSLRSGGWRYARNISEFPKLKESQKKELINHLLKTNTDYVVDVISQIDLNSEKDRVNFFQKLVKVNPIEAARGFDSFEIKSEDQIVAALVKVASAVPEELAENFADYRIAPGVHQRVFVEIIKSLTEEREFHGLSLLLDKTFKVYYGSDPDWVLGLVMEFLEENDLIPVHRQPLDPRVDTFTLRYQAFAAICLAKDQLLDAPQEVPLSRVAAQKLSGLPEKFFVGSQTSQSLADLYINIFSELSQKDEKRVVNFIEPLPTVKEANEVLSLARAYSCLKKAVGKKAKNYTVSNQNIQERTKDLRDQCRTLMSELFSVNISDHADIGKNADNIVAVAILAGRYQENLGWRTAMPMLKEIIQHMVNGTFKKFKYDDPTQTEFLTPEQLEVWKEPELSVQVISPDELKPENILTKVSSLFNNNLLVHSLVPVNPKEIIDLPAGMLTDDRSFRKSFGALSQFGRSNEVCIKLMSQLIIAGDLENLRALTSRISSSPDLFYKQEPGIDLDQLKKDFTDLKNSVRAVGQGTKHEYVSVAMITDDPYILFTIGNIVEASSCQSYTTGSHANTLPAYVVDANIQAGLNFILPVARLGAVGEALRDRPEDVVMNLDLINRKLIFTSGEDSAEMILDKALSRRVMRLGYQQEGSKKYPVILPEPSYYQIHGVQEQGDRQLLDLMIQKNGRITPRVAEYEENVHFPATRHEIHGVYTDKGGDIQTAEYEIRYTED